MNKDIYVFGRHTNGEDFQYPEDEVAVVFTNFINHAKTTRTIAIHRKGNLMYYGLIRKNCDNSFWGICFVLNDVMLSDKPDNVRIFKEFENTILSHIDIQALRSGNKHSVAKSIYTNIEPQLDVLSEDFDKLEFATLPPLSYKTPAGSIKEFNINDNWALTAKSSYTRSYTIISDPIEQIAQDKVGQNNTPKDETSELPAQNDDTFFSTQDVIIVIVVGLVALFIMCLLFSYYQ